MAYRTVTALGAISGTSLDGVDCAIVSSDGHVEMHAGDTYYRSYDQKTKEVLLDASACARALSTKQLRKKELWPDVMRLAEDIVTTVHGKCIEDFLSQTSQNVTLVGFHGQTILHRSSEGFTLQIGDAEKLADRLSLPVVYDFRSLDMMNGGHGAPLAPFYHFVLAKNIGLQIQAFVNIGGIANVTWVDAGKNEPQEAGALLAFDTGPGNVFSDMWMQENFQLPYDEGGMRALEGTVDHEIVADFIKNEPFFHLLPPKSLDICDIQPPDGIKNLAQDDALATLSALTAESILESAKWFPKPVERWVICGGGEKNSFFIKYMHARGYDVAMSQSYIFAVRSYFLWFLLTKSNSFP
jgi:anhydro-N-acetylmuramic acid kinase